jgi:16S rRNA (adenine1518-N6/adenine1519-N6)-dimethyltransferase
MHAQALLRKYGVTPKKRWSQYFLVSPSIIRVMASYARGTVVEIGPGLGFITVELAKKADRVIAVEKDRAMVNILNHEYSFDNVDIINEDILEIDLPRCDRVISNIPYHISSQITFKLLAHSFELGVLSYQKEFAQRLVTPPSPAVSRLSVMAQMRGDFQILKVVSRKNYYPVPKTDCALVTVAPRGSYVPDQFFEHVVIGLYSHKRKTVKNALLSSQDVTGITKEQIRASQIPFEKRRVWSLTLEEVSALVEALKNCTQG